ncbi:hypothetical protein FACS1894187_16310 [Synergistales bacterium]|nr:hypothetical protein FACS1894187_16310 [Synergistales bacterium]
MILCITYAQLVGMHYKYWLRNKYFLSALIPLLVFAFAAASISSVRFIRHRRDMTYTSKHTPVCGEFSINVPKSWNIGEIHSTHQNLFFYHLGRGDKGFGGEVCFSAWVGERLDSYNVEDPPLPSYVLMTVFKKELSTGPGFAFSAQELGEGLTNRMTRLGLRDMLKSEVKTMNGHQWVKTSASANAAISFAYIYWQTVDSWSKNHYVIAFTKVNFSTSELVLDNIVNSFTFLRR